MTSPADIIAANLSALPHPDGAPRQLPGFATRLLPEPMQQQVGESAKQIGESVVHLLELNGYRITDEPRQPTQTEAPPNIAHLHCAQCDTRLMSLNIVNPEHAVTNGRALLQAFAARSLECPHI